MQNVNLVFQGRKTNSFYLLQDAKTKGGATVTRRAGGFSDYGLIQNLIRLGWVEPKNTGVRGGIRFHITRRGRYHMAKTIKQLGE